MSKQTQSQPTLRTLNGRTEVVMAPETEARRRKATAAFRDRFEAALIACGRGAEVEAVRKRDGR